MKKRPNTTIVRSVLTIFRRNVKVQTTIIFWISVPPPLFLLYYVTFLVIKFLPFLTWIEPGITPPLIKTRLSLPLPIWSLNMPLFTKYRFLGVGGVRFHCVNSTDSVLHLWFLNYHAQTSFAGEGGYDIRSENLLGYPSKQ